MNDLYTDDECCTGITLARRHTYNCQRHVKAECSWCTDPKKDHTFHNVMVRNKERGIADAAANAIAGVDK